jgi:hypothetical protein
LIGLVLFAACEKNPEPQPAAGTSADAPAGAAAVSSADSAAPVTNPPAVERPQYPNAVGLMFNPERIARGDTAAGLRVTTAAFARALALPDSPYVGHAGFRGLISLDGKLMQHPDPSQRALCFEADAPSAMRLPRMMGDERRAWLCFRNHDAAAAMLGDMKPPQSVHITIDDYSTTYSFSDVNNEAKLVNVTRLKAP